MGEGEGESRMVVSTAATQTGVLEYSLTVGLSAMEGRGFYYPVDTLPTSTGRLYVVNRSVDGVDRGVRVTMCDIDSEYYGTFASAGDGDGQFVYASSIAEDSQGRVFISDEYANRVTAFDMDGKFLWSWGTPGSAEGELDGPSGVAVGANDSVYVADTHNNRVQKFTPSGVLLLTFGSKGAGEGQLDLPWGVTVAPNGDVYVADWGNDRVQRFTPDGDFVACYGTSGRGDGELRRPSSVAVDERGYIYVADWGNERIQVFDPDGGFVQKLRGQATESKWAGIFLNVNKEEAVARARADLEPEVDLFDPDDPHEESSHIEKLFWSPVSVKLDDSGRLYVTESNRHRIQIYERVS